MFILDPETRKKQIIYFDPKKTGVEKKVDWPIWRGRGFQSRQKQQKFNGHNGPKSPPKGPPTLHQEQIDSKTTNKNRAP